MFQQPSSSSWSDRLSVWQELLDTKWRGQAESAFLRFTQIATWAYVFVVVVVWLILHTAGDRWWAASLLLFGPRWLGLLPVVVLVPLAIVLRRRLLLPLIAVTSLFLLGVMGYCVPVPFSALGADPERTVKVLSCNVHMNSGGWDRLRRVILQESPDIVGLQEMNGNEGLPFPDDWHVARDGEFVIASPYPVTQVEAADFQQPAVKWRQLKALYAVVEMPGRPVGVCNIHLTSPQEGLTEVLDRHTLVSLNRTDRLKQVNELRRQESEFLSQWSAERPRVDVVLGDFNLPIESRIYRRYWGGYRNVFSAVGLGVGYTRWVTLHNFQYGARIDHILTTDAWRPVSCHVGRDVGSDHMPVIARISW